MFGHSGGDIISALVMIAMVMMVSVRVPAKEKGVFEEIDEGII